MNNIVPISIDIEQSIKNRKMNEEKLLKVHRSK